jgi:sigma-70-like protein
MITVHNFRHSEFRKRVTEAILEMLTHLPETQRNIFVWNHYCGYQPKEIAEILKSSPSEVEATLDAINAILYQRAGSLLKEVVRLKAEMDLPAAFSRKTKVTRQHSIIESVVEHDGIQQGWTEMLDRLTECVAKA